MEREIIKKLKVLTTDKYCGDFENHKPCPQYLTSRMGTIYHCGAYYSDDGLPYTTLFEEEGSTKLERCKKCLEYFNEDEKYV